MLIQLFFFVFTAAAATTYVGVSARSALLDERRRRLVTRYAEVAGQKEGKLPWKKVGMKKKHKAIKAPRRRSLDICEKFGIHRFH